MSTAALKRELALLRSSLAALTPAQSAALDDPIVWAERIDLTGLEPRLAPAGASSAYGQGASYAGTRERVALSAVTIGVFPRSERCIP